MAKKDKISRKPRKSPADTTSPDSSVPVQSASARKRKSGKRQRAKVSRPMGGSKPRPTGLDYVSSDERRAIGKALRDTIPRASQAGWKPANDRRDPVEFLLETNEGRIPALIPIRMGRMASSPFAFYRGSAAQMAADLATIPTTGLRVQACGDAHLMNFGGFATPERNVIFDVNDLDETLPAPFEWDVKRLAASVVIAAQHLRFSDNDAKRLAIDTVRTYREQMAVYASMRALDVWYDRIDLTQIEFDAEENGEKVAVEIRKRAKQRIAAERKKSLPEALFPQLTELNGTRPRIKDEPPLIFHPTKEQAPGMELDFQEAIATYRESLAEHTRVLFDRFSLFDLAIKAVGVGSVGRTCGVALFMAENEPLFLQLKEARASILEPYAGKSLHSNHGQRVIAGQRLMQAASDQFLGWTRGQDGRDYYVRQLRDMKISALIGDWNVPLKRAYVRLCARALARAHARSGDAAMISGYLGSGENFDNAIGQFALDYAHQNRSDYRAFNRAIRDGRIQVNLED